jgi:hypothetical protein
MVDWEGPMSLRSGSAGLWWFDSNDEQRPCASGSSILERHHGNRFMSRVGQEAYMAATHQGVPAANLMPKRLG